MTQEEKNLLLKDLSARLPYGVKLNMKGLIGVSHHTTILYGKNTEMYFRYCHNDYFINEIKPYLFPMSSMTEEQEEEYNKLNCYELGCFPHLEEALDYLIENHFDYRGLIDKGLALDATNKNIY